MAANWYAKVGGDQFGPIPYSTIQAWVADGRISPNDWLREGESNPWRAAVTAPGLFVVASSAPPPSMSTVAEPAVPQVGCGISQGRHARSSASNQSARRKKKQPVGLYIAGGIIGLIMLLCLVGGLLPESDITRRKREEHEKAMAEIAEEKQKTPKDEPVSHRAHDLPDGIYLSVGDSLDTMVELGPSSAENRPQCRVTVTLLNVHASTYRYRAGRNLKIEAVFRIRNRSESQASFLPDGLFSNVHGTPSSTEPVRCELTPEQQTDVKVVWLGPRWREGHYYIGVNCALEFGVEMVNGDKGRSAMPTGQGVFRFDPERFF